MSVANWLYSLRLYDYVDLFDKLNFTNLSRIRELGEAELATVCTYASVVRTWRGGAC